MSLHCHSMGILPNNFLMCHKYRAAYKLQSLFSQCNKKNKNLIQLPALNHPPSIDRPHYELNKYTETQQLLTLQCDSTIHCETFITSCNKKFSNSRDVSYSTKGFFDMLNRLGMIMSLTANRQTDGRTNRQTKAIAYSGDKPISIKLRV